MRKRERENPCAVCGHYHKYEEGEVCGICGHRMPDAAEKSPLHVSAFPSEILPDFLYLGSYDNASRSELLKAQGISRVLNTVPACQNLYKNSFTYHCLQDDRTLQFDDANQFLEQCEKDKCRVLVHCMSGRNRIFKVSGDYNHVIVSRSPAIVMAYLMKSKGWRLSQSYQWVKERRASVDLTQAVYQLLQEYERKIFGSCDSGFPPSNMPSFNFGFPKVNDPVATPAFTNLGAASIFARPLPEVTATEFQFGAVNPPSTIPESTLATNPPNGNGGDIQMDS